MSLPSARHTPTAPQNPATPFNVPAWLGVRVTSIVLAVCGCLILDALCRTFVQDYFVRLIVLAGLYVTLAVSLNLINGITGQFSIGHAGFYMVGAYAGGFVSSQFFDAQPLDAPAWLFVSLLVGAAAAAVAGLLVGLPSLRLKGDYLAIVTLGFGEIIRIIAINQPQLGGSYGFNVTPKIQAIWLVWLLAIVAIAVSRNLLKTSHGLAFLAVREDEIAAQAMGVNITRTKVTAFVIGAAFAGAAGALFAHNEGYLNPDLFKMEVSFLILTMVVLGGSGSITGATLAAVVLFIVPELPRILPFQISLALLLGIGLGIASMVAAVRYVRDSWHGPKEKRILANLAAVFGPIAAGTILGLLVQTFTILGDITYDANKLRFVILAVTLLVVMLIRPQGVMGHHEFSWNWLKSLYTKKPPPMESSL